ncbi:hypothetical protein ACOMHN_032842 [Nucella lapillus]
MLMMRARVQGHRWVDHPAAAVMEARVPGQWVDRPAAMEKQADGDYSSSSFHSVKDDALVDWSRPVLGQVWGLGDHYYRWVHEPVDFSLRLFQSDFMERISKCPWYMVPAFWVPVALLLLMRSRANLVASEPVVWNLAITDVTVTLGYLPLLVLLGVVLWTFCEYSLHRWLFHMKPPSGVPLLILLHFALHGQHHKHHRAPMDRTRLVFPTLPACVLGGLIFGLYGLFCPWPVAQALFTGTVVGYMVYDLTHYYIHHGTPAMAYFADLKRYHVKHHFEHQQLGFGISSKLWDYPFGTLIPDSD